MIRFTMEHVEDVALPLTSRTPVPTLSPDRKA